MNFRETRRAKNCGVQQTKSHPNNQLDGRQGLGCANCFGVTTGCPLHDLVTQYGARRFQRCSHLHQYQILESCRINHDEWLHTRVSFLLPPLPWAGRPRPHKSSATKSNPRLGFNTPSHTWMLASAQPKSKIHFETCCEKHPARWPTLGLDCDLARQRHQKRGVPN
jgi:hypothetical protein